MNDASKVSKAAGRCWNVEGVWAPQSPTCPKLKECVHCANCEVFVANGRELFERVPENDYLSRWAKQLADSREGVATESEAILIFRLGDEWLAFPASSFKSVAPISPIHSIPGKGNDLLSGVASVEGVLRLCFSLKTLLGLDATASSDSSNSMAKPRFLLLESKDGVWAFPVDELLGVFSYDAKTTKNIPSTVSKANPNFVKRVFQFEGRTVGLLDNELTTFAFKRSLL